MNHRPSSQRGAALIVAMMMLLVMTLLGVAGMQTSVLEEKMSGNFRDKDLALQTAEAALRFGEDIAATKASGGSNNNGFPDDPDSDGECNADAGNNYACLGALCSKPDKECPPRWEVEGFTGWTAADGTVNPGGLATTPQYFIEYLGNDFACTRSPNACSGSDPDPCNCRRYRITTRIPTSGKRARVMLQSVYATE